MTVESHFHFKNVFSKNPNDEHFREATMAGNEGYDVSERKRRRLMLPLWRIK
jgi:hypothetical protein